MSADNKGRRSILSLGASSKDGTMNPLDDGTIVMSSITVKAADGASVADDVSQSMVSQQPIPYGDWESKMSVETRAQLENRDTWSNQLDFLMTCVSMSVGFGNIYRFPYIAYTNGGGAFLIPYMVVLLIVGRPMYFFELLMGQFSSVGCVKMWEVVPGFKGIGYAMCIASACTVTFYCSIMATCLFFFFASFSNPLPWSECNPSLYLLDGKQRNDVFCPSESQHKVTMFNPVSPGPDLNPGSDVLQCPNKEQGFCKPITNTYSVTSGNGSNAELYFRYHVVQGYTDIDNGIGYPEWKMSLALLGTWILIFGTLVKGTTGSGKVAWFTAIFPYVILIVLFGMSVSLPNAMDGIYYLFLPDWAQLLEIRVWFQAVQQCFFSLGMGFGPVIIFGSYNEFHHNLYREVWIVSIMDTLTSLLAGSTIFAILGNLAAGGDIEDVVTAGPNIAFVSYPSVLDDFGSFPVPQIFSVLFFLMLLTLGIGSGISFTQVIIQVFMEAFPKSKRWLVTLVVCIVGCTTGLIYVTPGGPFMLLFADTFGSGFILYVVVLLEVIAIGWVYGLRNFVNDIQFMLNNTLSWYWKICWGILIPFGLLFVLIYHLFNFETPEIGHVPLPRSVFIMGIMLSATITGVIPVTAVFVIVTRKTKSAYKKFRAAFYPSRFWGPADPILKSEWESYKKTVPYRYHPWRICKQNHLKGQPSRENLAMDDDSNTEPVVKKSDIVSIVSSMKNKNEPPPLEPPPSQPPPSQPPPPQPPPSQPPPSQPKPSQSKPTQPKPSKNVLKNKQPAIPK